MRLSTTLSIYIGRQFFWGFMGLLLIILMIVLLFDMVELLRRAHGETDVSFTQLIEMALLKMFVENKGRVLSRNVILERVWSDTYITDRTIDSHVKELRKKIPPMAQLLKTVYGSGYRLDL